MLCVIARDMMTHDVQAARMCMCQNMALSRTHHVANMRQCSSLETCHRPATTLEAGGRLRKTLLALRIRPRRRHCIDLPAGSIQHFLHVPIPLVEVEHAAIEKHVRHLLADHASTRRVRKIVVVKVAREGRHGHGAEVASISSCCVRGLGSRQTLALKPGNVLIESLDALEAGVAQLFKFRPFVHDLLHLRVDNPRIHEELQVAFTRGSPLGHRLLCFLLTLTWRLIARMQGHCSLTHLSLHEPRCLRR
mmetsp:Transcript_17093/g.49540  ORF Transcript_17093/g.49540 Transcript_17093/m.49540 type:complete len:249 (-) Transcript_17093:155-901(-)